MHDGKEGIGGCNDRRASATKGLGTRLSTDGDPERFSASTFVLPARSGD